MRNQFLEVMKEVLIALGAAIGVEAVAHKNMKSGSTPVEQKDGVAAGEKKDSSGSGEKKSGLKEGFAAVGRAFWALLSNDERNALNIELISSGNKEGVEALLGIELEKLEDENPLAENKFAKVVAGIVGDAKAKFAKEPEAFKKFFDELLGLAVNDPERFLAVLELSDNNIVEQYIKAGRKFVGAAVARTNEQYERNRSWVRRERSTEDGTIAGNFAATVLPSVTGIWAEVMARVPGTEARKARRVAAARTKFALGTGVEVVPEENACSEVPLGSEPPVVEKAKEPIGVLGFVGKVIGDLWSTANWYVRRIVILIVGLLSTNVVLFLLFGASSVLIGLVIVTVFALLHLIFIRFRYPLILAGIMSVEEFRKGVERIVLAFVGVCFVSLALAFVGIMIEGGELTLFDTRMFIVSAVLLGAMGACGYGPMRRKILFVAVGIAMLASLLAVFPGIREKLPDRLAKVNQVFAQIMDTTARAKEPVPVVVPGSYAPYIEAKVPPTLRPGWVRAEQPAGEPMRDTLLIVGNSEVESRMTVSQEANTLLVFTVLGKGGPLFVKQRKQAVDGSEYESVTTVPVDSTSDVKANDGRSIVGDYRVRYSCPSNGSTDTVRVIERCIR
jgi:hypothetical protein